MNAQPRTGPCIAVKAFLSLLQQANSIAVFDTPRETTWTVSEATGDPENEIIRFHWEEDGRSCAAIFNEEGIAAGKWVGQSYFCPDIEGDEVQISLYTRTPLAQQNEASNLPAPLTVSYSDLGLFTDLPDIPDLDGKNGARAHHARVALAAYVATADAEAKGAVAGLLTALIHECDRLGLDFIDQVAHSVRLYDEQTGAHAESIPDHLELALGEAKKLLNLCFENKLKTADEAQIIDDYLDEALMVGTLASESPIYPRLRTRARNLVALNRASLDVKEQERDRHYSPQA